MPNSVPPTTFGGITRPALIFDNAGNIILTPEVAAFAAAYGTKALYFGLPANTPFPPVAPTLSVPADNNAGVNSVLENAAVGTQVGITVQATNVGGPPVTYSLTDNPGNRFQINATTGVVTVAGPLDYETAPGHAYNITVQATDGILTSSQTFTIGVGNVNEAPQGRVNGTVTASEDTNYVFSAADFGFTDTSDSSAPNALAAVRITTLPATGTLLNNGVAVVAGASVSVADINAGHLVFVPAANTSGTGYANFTFQVRDNGGTANGGVDTDQSPETITINVNAVNDAPTATNLTQSLTINEDAAAAKLFPVNPVVADIENNTVTATLTLNASAGVLVGAGAGALSAGVLTYTITGTAAAVNTALALVTYDSAPNFSGAASVGIAVTDGANGPQGTNPTGTVSITVNSVNDAPAGADNTVTTTEDTNRVFTSADFGFSDTSDSPANALAAVVITTLPASGTLLNNGVPVNAGDSVSAAAIAAGQLRFVPAADANGAGYASFTFQVRDNGGTASGGVDLDQSVNTITINVTAGNDAPINSVPGTQSVNEEASLTFSTGNGNAITISDVDIGSGDETVTLTVTSGTLALGSTAGLTSFTNNSASITLTGTVANINAALNGLTYTGNLNFNGADSLVVSTSDNGNTGTGGPQNDTDNITINVAAVNDNPVNGVPGAQTVNEDANLVFTGANAITISDVDAGSGDATVTLTVTGGTLALGSTLNLTSFTNNAASITLTGTIANINAALNGLTYHGNLNFNGPDSLSIVTHDNGNTGGGDLTDTDSVTINVTAVNDAPTATNLTQSLILGEDAAATALFTLAPVVSDVDSAAVTATLTLDAAAGVLTGAGVGVLNAGVLTYTITGTPAAVSTALAGVAFDSAPDFNGITDVGITIDDGANGPQGSNPIGTGTVTINAVNDAPTATNLTQSLSVGEDGAAATLFTLAPVVADVDSSNVTATLTLDAAAGVLTGAGAGVLNAGVLTYTITGTAAAVNTALAAVTYDSAANFSGPTNVGVTIDDGANGPQGTNPTGTISITVNAVNDAPTATNLNQTLVINEDAAATTLFTGPPVAADIDSANVTATLTLDAAAGTLNGAGAGVLAAGVLTYTITGTPAAVNAALAAVTYDSAPNFFGTTSVGVTIDDGANGPQGSPNPTGSIDITVNSVNDAPTVAATANNPAYAAPPVDLFSGVTASTVESGQSIVQLVLTVTNISDTDESLVIDGDTVSLVDGTVSGAPTATLGVSYSVAVSGGTATITITITSPGLTGAQTGTLIDGLAYTNTVVSPGDPARVVTIVSLTDDGGNLLGGVATGTPGIASTVNFNIAPSIDVDGEITYVENGAATLVDNSIAVSDPDDTDMESATVVISSGYAGAQDVLTFTNTLNITGSLVGNTLTATGTATLAEYQTFLQSVRYQNTSDDPSTADRILTYTVNDGFVDSPSDTATIHVVALNDAPAITPTGGSTAYIENAAAVTIDGSLTVTDPDSSITSAQVRVSVGFQTGDSLNFVDQNGITGVYTPGTGVLLLSGTASVADYQAALRSITFSSTSNDPGVSKTIEFKVNDATVDSNLATRTLAITPVNDEPTLTTSGLNPGFTENGAAVDLFSTPVVASAIEAGQNLNNLVLTVTNVAGTGTTESLTIDGTIVALNTHTAITATNGMTASVVLVGTTATVTISKVGGVSAAIIQSIVDGLAYDNTSDDPGAAIRAVTLTSLSDDGPTGGANDNIAAFGIGSSVAVTPVNDAPVVDLVTGGGVDNTATTATFSEGAGPPSTTVLALPNLDLADVDSADLTGATVTVTDFVSGQDVLTVSGSTSGSIGGVNFSVSASGVITFSGTASVTAYETAIQAVQYNNSSENPAPGARHFEVQVTDGTDASTIATATVNVNGQNDAPVNTIPADADVPTAFSNTDTAISGISIGDVDAGSGIVTTQLSVTNGTVAVSLAGGATISAGVNGTATLTLSGTVAAINATLANNVTFHSTDGYTGQADLTVLTHDGSNSGLGGPLTDSDVINIGVVPQVWYIDNTNFAANGAGGTGTVADPFRSIADFNDSVATGVNDYIVIRTGTGTYTGEGLDLQDGQQVWGAGETLSFTNPVNGAVVNIANAGTRPTLNVTAASDLGIDLAGNNTIRNLNITTAAGTSGLNDGNNSVGNLVIRNMDISGAGTAIDIDQGGILDVQLGSVSSTGGTFGIQLGGTSGAGSGLLSGSFSATGGALSGSTSAAFIVGDGTIGAANTGGTASISYGGSITASNGARVVDVQDHATGAVTFTGSLTHNGTSGAGIILDDNSSNFTFSGANLNLNTGSSNGISITDQTGGTTVAFSGTVNIDTTTGGGVNFGGTSAANVNFTGNNLTIDTVDGAGFVANATTNSTVNVTGTGNTINSTSATALNITSTTIGASNVTFQSISSGNNTAAADPVSGIILNNTGSSGNLNVTGTGATDGTGGTIQNTTGDAISLTNTQDVNLKNMNITGADGNGIFGNVVNGLVLSNLDISGSGNSTSGHGEGNIYLFELTGNASHATTFDDLNVTNSYVHNVFIENSSGTLTNLVVTDSTFSNNGASTFAGSQFVVNLASGGVAGTPTATVHATHNTFSGNLSSPATFTATGFQGSSNDGTLNVHLGDGTAGGLNTFNTNNSGITLSSSNAGNLNFDVNNNTVTNNRAVGIAVNHFGTGTVTGFLRNTTIGTQGQAGSGAQIGNGLDLHDEAFGGSMTLSVTNNIIQSVGGGGLGFEGINAQIGVGAQNSASTFNLTLTGNTIRDIVDDRGLFVNNFNTAGASVINANISGNTFTNANASGANTTARVGGAPGGSDHVNVTQASAAALAAANGLTASAAPGNTMRVDTNVFFSQPAPPAPPATPQMALNGQGPGSSEVLTMDALAPLLAVAIAHWAAAGASAAQIEQMWNAHIRIADLPNSGFLANSDEHGITIDSNAAGWGWFIDSTPADNAEYQATTLPGQLAATSGSAASRIDLLTVIEHELGHMIGLEHSNDAGVMNVALDTGERRLPDAADVALADPGQAQAQAPLLPVIRGTAGNDTINAGHGGVILVGEAGADNFVFTNVQLGAASPMAITHVADYSFVQGDSFDFSALTSAFHGSGMSDASVVRAVEDASGSFATLQVNASGAGPSPTAVRWVDVAQIDGAQAGDDVSVLIDSHGAVHLAHLHVGLLA